MIRRRIDPEGRCPPGAVALESVDNEMQFRGLSRLAKEDNSKKPANDVSGGKPAKRRRADGARDSSVGSALRSVYAQTVDEAVPSEFLDLLNKLD